jgi:hypothetical protein
MVDAERRDGDDHDLSLSSDRDVMEHGADGEVSVRGHRLDRDLEEEDRDRRQDGRFRKGRRVGPGARSRSAANACRTTRRGHDDRD